jgi:hypothetical protein
MKQKITVIVLLFGLLQLNSFAQGQKSRQVPAFPLLIEDDIRSITVSDNIDLVLIQTARENVNVRVHDNAVDKIRIRVEDRGIFLSATKKLSKGERLIVYANVNDLENLTLKGNAFAMSRGVLGSHHLHVNIDKGAKVALKSNGTVQVHTDGKYQISKETEEYSSVFAAE